MDGITECVDTRKPIRRRKDHAKQPPSLSSASATVAAAGKIEKTKNAVMLLNELQPGGLRYNDVTKSGPDHKPIYTASVTIYGQVLIILTCLL